MTLAETEGKHSFPQVDPDKVKEYFADRAPAITPLYIPPEIGVRNTIDLLKNLPTGGWTPAGLNKRLATLIGEYLPTQLPISKLIELSDKEERRSAHKEAYFRQQQSLEFNSFSLVVNSIINNTGYYIFGSQSVMHSDFYRDLFVFTDNPLSYHLKNRVLHNDKDVAVEYKSERGIYFLHGVRVPKWLVTTPAEYLDGSMIGSIANAQVRAEFIKKVGLFKCLDELGVTELDAVGDYVLLSLVVTNRREIWLKMKNPSVEGMYHLEPVHPNCQTVQEALNYRAYGHPKGWRIRIPLDDIPFSEHRYREEWIDWKPQKVT